MTFKRGLLSLLKRLVIGYLLICLFMWSYQRHLMYFPQTVIREPAAYGLADTGVVRLTAGDGTHIQAWYHKPVPGYPTLLYFHGNGGNLGDRARYYKLLMQDGFGLMAVDYRGYGASEGSPSETGFYEDARAAIEYLVKAQSLPAKDMIFYGESIGTGVAVQMATEYTPAAVILQSPFTSLVARGQALYPWLPVTLLEKDGFNSLSKIGRVHAPLLVLHGEKDETVPVADGKALFAAALSPKEAVYYPLKGHENLDLNELSAAVVAFSRKYGLITIPHVHVTQENAIPGK